MFCEKCGKELRDEEKFCAQCGTPVNQAGKTGVQKSEKALGERKRQRKKKSWILLPLATVAVLICVSVGYLASGGLRKKHTGGFDTPEAALEYFVQAVSEQDYEKALEAFPVETAAEHFEFYENSERMNCWSPYSSMPVPDEAGANRWLNQNFFAVSVADQINNFIFSFFAADKALEHIMILEYDEVWKTFRDYNAENIKELKILKMKKTIVPEEFLENSLENRRKIAGIYGADTLEPYLIRYQIMDDTYIGGVTFIKYGEEYYIWELQNSYEGTGYDGYVTREDKWEGTKMD